MSDYVQGGLDVDVVPCSGRVTISGWSSYSSPVNRQTQSISEDYDSDIKDKWSLVILTMMTEVTSPRRIVYFGVNG